jgi:C1A family cysteine protease
MFVMNYEPSADTPSVQKEVPVIDEEFISDHNEGRDIEFTLGGNKMFDGVNVHEARKFFNNYFNQKTTIPKCGASSNTDTLPTSFNWFDNNQQCDKRAFNQGLCTNSWAVAVASAFTDRFCALSGDNAYQASVQQLLTCEKKVSKACENGYIIGAAEYGRNRGFVNHECMKYNPYDIQLDCNYTEINKCGQKEKVKDYCSVEGTEQIQREIFANGPVVSLMPVHREFLVYKGGVYSPSQTAKRIEGSQAVKIVGWNTEGKTKYWIVENSFGDDWGSSGTAKVAMNMMDSSLDKTAVALTPLIEEEPAED